MSPLQFAWRSLSRQPARAVLGLTGVAVVGALLFDMLMLSRGLIVSFRDLLESTGFDVRVTATVAFSSETPLEVQHGGAMPAGGLLVSAPYASYV